MGHIITRNLRYAHKTPESYSVGDFVINHFYDKEDIGVVYFIDHYGWPVVFFLNEPFNGYNFMEEAPVALDKIKPTLKLKKQFKARLEEAYVQKFVDNLAYIQLLDILK